MTNKLFDLSGKIDPAVVGVLNAVSDCAGKLHLNYFVVGAAARDMLFQRYGLGAYRKTQDVDIGILVSSWDDFNRIIECLVSKWKFAPDRAKHGFSFDEMLVDIVPFGPVADRDLKISWPPEHEFVMSVAGFEEAYASSDYFKISQDPELIVRVVSLPGLAVLKIVSWKDNYPNRSRDAEDLFLIMKNYENCGIEDRLYGPELDMLRDEGYDNALAGIRLLGRDMAALCEPTAGEIVLDVLRDEKEKDKLLIHIIRNRLELSSRPEEVLSVLEKLEQGFVEGCVK